MRWWFAYLLAILTLVSSCNNKSRKIPEGTMSKIYAEMFVADQWITQNRLTRTADTSWVYESIFQKYGYSGDDYVFSVEQYMEDPEAFSAVIDRAGKIIRAQITAAGEQNRLEILLDSLIVAREHLYRTFTLAGDSLLVPSYLGVEAVYDKYNPYALGAVRPDSLYCGPELIAVDTLGLALLDSLKVGEDSLSAFTEGLANASDSLAGSVEEEMDVIDSLEMTRSQADSIRAHDLRRREIIGKSLKK